MTSASGDPVSGLWRRLPRDRIEEKGKIGHLNPDYILKKSGENHGAEKLNRMYDMKIERSDFRFQIRKSDTKPIIRVMTEAINEDAANRFVDAFTEEAGKLAGKNFACFIHLIFQYLHFKALYHPNLEKSGRNLK